tara:strand:- start:103 stop:261 length:159 start_codon:yes stop_codon:yes gene_type:complete
MSHAQFRTALNRLAAAENEGDDIEGDLGHLAAVSGVSRSDVRMQITEIQQDA